MSEFKAAITIERPPADVFSQLTDFEKWPRWQGGLDRVEQVGAGPLQVGTQIRLVRPGRSDREGSMEVTNLIPGQVLGLRSPGRPIAWHGTFTLEPSGNGSRLALHFQIQAAGLAGMIAEAVIRMTVKRELRTFKAMVEAG